MDQIEPYVAAYRSEDSMTIQTADEKLEEIEQELKSVGVKYELR